MEQPTPTIRAYTECISGFRKLSMGLLEAGRNFLIKI